MIFGGLSLFWDILPFHRILKNIAAAGWQHKTKQALITTEMTLIQSQIQNFYAISRSNVVAFQFDSWPCDLIRKGKETVCLLFFINPPNPKVNTKFVSLCPTFRALLLRETKESQIKSSNWFPVLYFWAIYVGMIPSKLQCIRNISTGLVTLS